MMIVRSQLVVLQGTKQANHLYIQIILLVLKINLDS